MKTHSLSITSGTSKLIQKKAGFCTKKLYEKIKFPQNAIKYNFISGFGKKGEFEIYSFFNSEGDLIKRYRRFLRENIEERSVTRYADGNSKTVEFVNGKIIRLIKNLNLWDGREKHLYAKIIIPKDIRQDTQTLMCCQKRNKPKIMTWTTTWDGTVPEIKYENMTPIFESKEGLEYLPVLTDRNSFQRFEHIYKAQLKKQDLEDVYSEFYIITKNDARNLSKECSDYVDTIGIAAAFDEKTGRTYFVADPDLAIPDEVTFIAHEVQHGKDYSDMARLEDTSLEPWNSSYYKKSRNKGLIKSDEQPQEYNRLKKLRDSLDDKLYYENCIKGRHDEIPIEHSANQCGRREGNLCSNVWRRIMTGLGLWNW